jgi:hypothetical protein
MRFMMLVKGDAKSEAGVLPDEKLLTDMGRLNEEMVNAGVMLAGEGLHASAKGTRVRQVGQKTTVVDGPFAEAKEVVAGYWIVQTKSKDEAVAWARRVPGAEGEIEIRQLYDMSDFPVDPSEKPEGWREKEQAFRDANEGIGKAPPRKPGTRRYIVMLRSDRATESGALPSPDVLAQMGALMTELTESGTMIGGEGLKPSSVGAKVRWTGDKRTVIDGPFTEAKEMIAGFCLLQAASKQEVVDFARRWLEIHVRGSGAAEGEIEIRPLHELSDFPTEAGEKPDGWRAQEQRLRERLGQ